MMVQSSCQIKIQDLGLASEYRSDHTMREFCGMIDALAFLPVSRVNDGVTYLQSIASPSALPLLQYFVQTYVSGDTIVGGVLCRRKATFKPETWNVYSETREESSRTNNFAEGWNNHFQHLVGHKHPTVWRLIEALQADAADVATKILQHSAGNLAPKRIDKETCSIQRRLKSLCDDLHAGQRTLTDFLQAVGHTIRF
jgi:hypothetical protein